MFGVFMSILMAKTVKKSLEGREGGKKEDGTV